MRCMRGDELTKAELGELTVNRLTEVDKHTAECSLCAAARAQVRALIEDLSHAPSSTAAEVFVDRVMKARQGEAAAADQRAARRPALPRWTRGRLPLALAAAAVVVLGVGLAELGVRGPTRTEPGTWTARGNPDKGRAPKVTSEVLLVRNDQLFPISGQSLGAKDRFAVRYVNRSERTQFLTAFAVDSAGNVHWIYPAYTDVGTDPLSTPLPATSQAQVLPQIVAPDRPLPGPMHVIAMTSPRPLRVKQVESVIEHAPRAAPVAGILRQRFPESFAQEWSCSWTLQQDAASPSPRR